MKGATKKEGRKCLALEPTFSLAETAAYLGLSSVAVSELVAIGDLRGRALDAERGGLWPVLKTGRRRRRVPLSAIKRHLAHLARRAGADFSAEECVRVVAVEVQEVRDE
jgi:hypothetical protein